MQWAYNPGTKNGDTRTVPLNRKYAVVQATKIDDGYVVIKNYSEKEYERIYGYGLGSRIYGSDDGERLSERGRGTYGGSVRNKREYAKVSGISDRSEGRNGFASRSLERSGENTGGRERSETVRKQLRKVSEIDTDIKKINVKRLSLQKEQNEDSDQVSEDFTNELISEGYDGVYYDGDLTEEYVVYNSA